MENSNGEDLCLFQCNQFLVPTISIRTASGNDMDQRHLHRLIPHGNFCQKLVHDTCDLHMLDCAYLRRDHSTLSEQRRPAAAML